MSTDNSRLWKEVGMDSSVGRMLKKLYGGTGPAIAYPKVRTRNTLAGRDSFVPAGAKGGASDPRSSNIVRVDVAKPTVGIRRPLRKAAIDAKVGKVRSLKQIQRRERAAASTADIGVQSMYRRPVATDDEKRRLQDLLQFGPQPQGPKGESAIMTGLHGSYEMKSAKARQRRERQRAAQRLASSGVQVSADLHLDAFDEGRQEARARSGGALGSPGRREVPWQKKNIHGTAALVDSADPSVSSPGSARRAAALEHESVGGSAIGVSAVAHMIRGELAELRDALVTVQRSQAAQQEAVGQLRAVEASSGTSSGGSRARELGRLASDLQADVDSLEVEQKRLVAEISDAEMRLRQCQVPFAMH